MKTTATDVWLTLYCRSRARMGILPPPFRWRYLLEWWGWRCYVIVPAWRWCMAPAGKWR